MALILMRQHDNFGSDSAHIFAYEPLITLFNISLQSLVFVDRSRGATMHTRGPPDPLEPRAQSPPRTAPVTLQWWRTTMRTATLEVVSTHSTEWHSVCPFELSDSQHPARSVCVLPFSATECVHTVCLSACVCVCVLIYCVCVFVITAQQVIFFNF